VTPDDVVGPLLKVCLDSFSFQRRGTQFSTLKNLESIDFTDPRRN